MKAKNLLAACVLAITFGAAVAPAQAAPVDRAMHRMVMRHRVHRMMHRMEVRHDMRRMMRHDRMRHMMRHDRMRHGM